MGPGYIWQKLKFHLYAITYIVFCHKHLLKFDKNN